MLNHVGSFSRKLAPPRQHLVETRVLWFLPDSRQSERQSERCQVYQHPRGAAQSAQVCPISPFSMALYPPNSLMGSGPCHRQGLKRRVLRDLRDKCWVRTQPRFTAPNPVLSTTCQKVFFLSSNYFMMPAAGLARGDQVQTEVSLQGRPVETCKLCSGNPFHCDPLTSHCLPLGARERQLALSPALRDQHCGMVSEDLICVQAAAPFPRSAWHLESTQPWLSTHHLTVLQACP